MFNCILDYKYLIIITILWAEKSKYHEMVRKISCKKVWMMKYQVSERISKLIVNRMNKNNNYIWETIDSIHWWYKKIWIEKIFKY